MEMPAAGDPTTIFGSLRLTGRISQRHRESVRQEEPPSVPCRPCLCCSLFSQQGSRTKSRAAGPAEFGEFRSCCCIAGRKSGCARDAPGCVLRLRYNITTGDFRPTSLAAGEGPATNQPRPRRPRRPRAPFFAFGLSSLSTAEDRCGGGLLRPGQGRE